MNTGNLVVLTILFSLALLAFQRTERRRLWLTALVLLAPTAYLSWRWAVYRGETRTALIAGLIALSLNLAFWLLYGRRHPPASSDSITVIGTEK
jgi:hypothetical protein